MISILTASSTMGRAAISRLQTLAPGASINACVRDPSRSANIPNTNVAITDASSYDSLCAALEGSRAAILVTPLDHARGFADDAAYSINAAEAVGVNRIIHVGQKAINFPRIVAPAVNSRDIGDAAAQLLCMPDAELQCSTWLT